MDKIKNSLALKLLATIIILLSCQPKEAKPQWSFPRPQITPRPLCATQFALVNSACSMLPYMQVPPPSPPSPPAPPVSHHHYRLRHSRRHRHSHHRHEPASSGGSPVEETCCRWLKEIDSVCVCELLVYLPSFLTRPVHNYTVAVEDLCEVNFQCGSRLVRKVWSVLIRYLIIYIHNIYECYYYYIIIIRNGKNFCKCMRCWTKTKRGNWFVYFIVYGFLFGVIMRFVKIM